MRIACVDLLFSWPPHGGADVDLFHVLQGLAKLGHEVKLFGVSTPEAWERGRFDPATLPFPAHHLDLTAREFDRHHLPSRIRGLVDDWKPDAVLVADGFFMKPYVIAALSAYPVAVRYYAHELACHRSILRYRDNAPCPFEYARTPEVCRKCALEGLRPLLQSGIVTSWTEEYLAARAFAPEYYPMQQAALRGAACAIVSNAGMAAEAAPYFDHVFVVPGGADVDSFEYWPKEREEQRPGSCGSHLQVGPMENRLEMVPPGDGTYRKPNASPLIILMTGRGEDPAKGTSVLLEAGGRLARQRADFEIRITMPRETPGPTWFRPLGWLPHERMREQYREADVVVAPSLWEEPFGLVAVEAMATGRPVCASRVGGLQEIVAHGETGLLFDRGDSAALAEALNTLLDDSEMRQRLGEAGRRRAEACYAWPRVLETHYPPILEYLAAWKGGPACG